MKKRIRILLIRNMVIFACPCCKSGSKLKYLNLLPKLVEKQEALAAEVLELKKIKEQKINTSETTSTNSSKDTSDNVSNNISVQDIEDRERRSRNLVFSGLEATNEGTKKMPSFARKS